MSAAPHKSSSSEAAAASDVTTLLGKGCQFEGKLSFEGTVRIDGKLTGEIFTDDALVIGEGAEINAEVHVGSVIIEGSVRGNIHAKRSVEIRTPGRVRGNITTPSLFIEKGVMFDGTCQMETAAPAEGKRAAGGASVESARSAATS